MKLATGGGRRGAATISSEVGDVQVWTPRFEGLDRKAHAAVVDEFRNRNRDRPFALRLGVRGRGRRARDQRGLRLAEGAREGARRS